LKHWPSTEPDVDGLGAAAGILDDCGDVGVRNALVVRISSRLLEGYERLFRDDPDLSWIDKIDQRFFWFRENLARSVFLN
jgi:hypothetical protein